MGMEERAMNKQNRFTLGETFVGDRKVWQIVDSHNGQVIERFFASHEDWSQRETAKSVCERMNAAHRTVLAQIEEKD
jgi:hypothetical protein